MFRNRRARVSVEALQRLGKAAVRSKGVKQVAMALAATTRLSADAAQQVMTEAFSSQKIGLRDTAAIARFKRRLAELAPEAADAIARIPNSTVLRPNDVASYLNQAALASAPLRGVPAVVIKSPTAEARRRFGNEFGKAFEQKASDRLVKYLYQPKMRNIRETLGETNQAVVLEFAPSSPAAGMEDLRDDELTDGRMGRVAEKRNTFLAKVATVRADLERSVQSSGTESALDVGSVVDVCWLNGTLRTVTSAGKIADMASEASLNRIGLPRFLARELDVTNATVGALAFRTKHNVMGAGITVAVLDGEVDPSHPALAGRVLQRKNFSREPWGFPDPHGTGVAGIIATASDTISGMAPAVIVANYKLFASNPALRTTDFDGALAIQQAVEDGALVINCSWGVGMAGDGTSREARACDAAWDLGVVLVKSAGNKGPAASSMTSPADARGVIVVGATDRQGKLLQDYSSRGPAGGKPGPDLVAPGGATGNAGIRSLKPGGTTGVIGRGTSFAAPHVSGLIALLLAHNKALLPDQIRAHLVSQCQPLKGIPAAFAGAGLIVL